ncbi:YbfB/YjiJ family MFS transporter [Mycobacterium sp. CBMA247]|nr:YbfB/YjiJ family MFS transporter [Mycolicibacterium sp. CBMA 329]MUL90161.1 YbfB/YjiJ family MFS transporter [Mycolicibacterium sp. CBMA 331]MUM00930.1 YbfB/YjiJ family MFS transporter [Mycolicibacterium sp. CBMA 334]MUM27470.1 YbfB/YjiJ family MFS transporter [Mycolicibacterium sp. CBMA 295]MUM39676.1 YbfB/YjiJ family MFS transporter [Mycolicibacterium sp. CBMA 247]MUM47623.1 YbfB/YjiJ family MFS transporter [Mycolicibacterium sp. CBMA 294]
MRNHAWTHVARTAAALAAAMGIGRFAYTPILPLMTAHAGLSAQAAGHLAAANYVGYLVGAVAGAVSPRLARSAAACRGSLVVLVASLAAMAVTTNVIEWLALRLVAGIASALVFVIAVNMLLDHLHGHPAHLPGWAFGGVGVGIALSAALVFVLPTNAGWRAAWWTAAALAAVLSVSAWSMRPTAAPVIVSTPNTQRHNVNRPFALLFGSYTLEGIGYIIAGTFLVAAVAQHSPGWLGNGTWLVVGLAVIPSAALWGRLSTYFSHPILLTTALLLQAAGIALACTGSGAAALLGAILFGGTFIGVSTLALAAGRLLQFPSAVALLTVGYSVGQIIGPVAVSPLLRHGFEQALIVGSLVVLLAALAAILMRIVGWQPHGGRVQAEVAEVAGECLDDGLHRGVVLAPSPHQ